MNHKNLFIFNGIVCLLFGISMMVVPSHIVQIYVPEDPNMSPYSDLITRAYGSLIFSVGIALFLAIKASESYGRRAILVLITLANGLLVVFHAYATLTGVENVYGWGKVLLVAILAGWGGKLLMSEKVD